jgi:dolichol-phosphate mannosyltransferase
MIAAATRHRSTRSVDLSIIVPTYNEVENAGVLVERLDECLVGTDWEVIFVDDDSPDGTASRIRELARNDSRVRLLHRIGRRGLSSAAIEGMLASTAPLIAVMDADLQHDEQLLPRMRDLFHADEELDIVIGSRHLAGGGVGNWSKDRQLISRLAARLSRSVLKAQVSDPMSGFFMLRRQVLDLVVRDLSGIGFKILLDILASSKRRLRIRELPYQFRTRAHGESKLDSTVAWEYLMMLLDKSLGRYVPVRFIPFAVVGGLGVLVHMAILWLLFRAAGTEFVIGQSVATLAAMTFNFFINNSFTYRDRRLHGWRLLRGWISFSIACSIGAVANIGIATYLFYATSSNGAWWIISATAGILVGAVWNYAVTSVYTWNKPHATAS